jgi:hypothetical protein
MWSEFFSLTPRALRDVDEAVSALNLPDDTWTRKARVLAG